MAINPGIEDTYINADRLQALTETQKAQARVNIGVTTSGGGAPDPATPTSYGTVKLAISISSTDTGVPSGQQVYQYVNKSNDPADIHEGSSRLMTGGAVFAYLQENTGGVASDPATPTSYGTVKLASSISHTDTGVPSGQQVYDHVALEISKITEEGTVHTYTSPGLADDASMYNGTVTLRPSLLPGNNEGRIKIRNITVKLSWFDAASGEGVYPNSLKLSWVEAGNDESAFSIGREKIDDETYAYTFADVPVTGDVVISDEAGRPLNAGYLSTAPAEEAPLAATAEWETYSLYCSLIYASADDGGNPDIPAAETGILGLATATQDSAISVSDGKFDVKLSENGPLIKDENGNLNLNQDALPPAALQGEATGDISSSGDYKVSIQTLVIEQGAEATGATPSMTIPYGEIHLGADYYDSGSVFKINRGAKIFYTDNRSYDDLGDNELLSKKHLSEAMPDGGDLSLSVFKELVRTLCPLGEVLYFDVLPAQLPDGVYLMDGSTINRADFPEFFEARGISEDIYTLSNAVNRFVCGYDPDGSRTIGSYQEDAGREISAGWGFYGESFYSLFPRVQSGNSSWVKTRDQEGLGEVGVLGGGDGTSSAVCHMFGFNSSQQVPTADHFRPENINLTIAIRLKYPAILQSLL